MIDIIDGHVPSEVWIINATRVRRGLGPILVEPTTGLLRGRAPGSSLLDIGEGHYSNVFYAKVRGSSLETLYTLDEAFATLSEANEATKELVQCEAQVELARHSQILAKLDDVRRAVSA